MIHELQVLEKTITFIWAPSHYVISGNEKADQASRLATTDTQIRDLSVLHRDVINNIKHSIQMQCEEIWKQQHTKLQKLLPNLTRRETLVLRRLRNVPQLSRRAIS